jgi:type I restriction enzyme S subunit
MFMAQSYVGHKLCQPGDLVVNTMWAWMGALGVSRHHGIVSPAYAVYRPIAGTGMQRAFAHELLRTAPYVAEYVRRSTGVQDSRLRLYPEQFLRIPVLQPPDDDQHAICAYLQALDRRITRYIRAKQKLIALLSEQRQAIIHRAVTRGLDPNVRLKPSGVEWLGEVPEHWEAVPLRRRWVVTDCKHLTVPFVQEGGIPLASVREACAFDLQLDGAKRTTEAWYELLIQGDRMPLRGDLIYCRNVSVGACAFVGTDEPFAMGQDVCLIRSSAQNQRYLNYFLHSPAMARQLAALSIGSTFPRINVADVKALTVAVPPREEQDAIVAYLDACLARADGTAAALARNVTLSREYRTRVVADVVTGKLDVREAAARLPGEDFDVPEACEPDEVPEDGDESRGDIDSQSELLEGSE